MTGLELGLAAAIFGLLYPIIGYPLVLTMLAALCPRPVHRRPCAPSVTVLVPAYNEAAVLEATIRNKLALQYPRDLLEVIVISDGSDDGSDEIAAQFAPQGVQLLRLPRRAGKAAALNHAVARARGEIIVFADANAAFAGDAVARMVENFADPQVGYLTGRLELTSGSGPAWVGRAYLRYESCLRRLETRVHSVIGVNGGVDAMRRRLYEPVPPDQISDLVLPLGVIAAGYRVVFDSRVHSREQANQRLADEFHMRVRVALRALRGLHYSRSALRHPLPAFCIVSHKVLRYLGFLFMGAALVLNALLLEIRPAGWAAALLLLQAGSYALALLGLALRRALPVAAVPGYLLLTYAAFAVAVGRFLRGDVVATWRPRAG